MAQFILFMSQVTSTVFDQPGVSLMTFQKSSWHTDVSPPVSIYFDWFDFFVSEFNQNLLRIKLIKIKFIPVTIHLTNDKWSQIDAP